jgi:hypothetical protein
MDDAIDEVLKMIRNKLSNITYNQFQLSKKKNFDTIASSRFDLNKISNRYLNTIKGNKYNFYNLLNMENYSNSISKESFIKFFKKVFDSDNSLIMTVYVNYFLLFNFLYLYLY